MKVVILAGGLGSRLSEITKDIPKPMIKVGGIPIIVRIIMHYRKFGLKDFIIAGGYKCYYIKNYFKKKKHNLNIKVVNTGKNSMTGGRLLFLKKYLDKETFLLTYGDGLSNVNIKKLIDFHKKNKKIGTVTAVHPAARFGEIILKKNLVSNFKEKPQTKKDWINGGFFVFDSKFLDYIKSPFDVLESKPLEKLTKQKQLIAFKHEGFWQCMDTKRDLDYLNKKFKK